MTMTKLINDLWVGTTDHIMSVIEKNIQPSTDMYWELNQIMISVQRSDGLSFRRDDYSKAMKRLIAQGKAELKFLNGSIFYIFK